VGDAAFCARCEALGAGASMPAAELESLRTRLVDDGYFTTSATDQLAELVSLPAVRAGMSRLVAVGWPATMILLYDEAWAIAHHFASLIGALLQMPSSA